MNHAEVLDRKLYRADEFAELMAEYAMAAEDDFVNDRSRVAAAERGLQACIESLTDACELILLLMRAKIGASARVTVERALRAKVVTQDQARRLIRLIELENRMVHDYERISPERVYQHLAPTVSLYRELAQRLRRIASK